MAQKHDYSVNKQTGLEEIGFYDDKNKHAIVTRRHADANGGPMNVYQCLRLLTTADTDKDLMTVALVKFQEVDSEKEGV